MYQEFPSLGCPPKWCRFSAQSESQFSDFLGRFQALTGKGGGWEERQRGRGDEVWLQIGWDDDSKKIQKVTASLQNRFVHFLQKRWSPSAIKCSDGVDITKQATSDCDNVINPDGLSTWRPPYIPSVSVRSCSWSIMSFAIHAHWPCNSLCFMSHCTDH